jgi:hypothetical protein
VVNSTLGYQQKGSTVLNVLASTAYQEGTFVGPRAGSSITSVQWGAVAIGSDALRSLTNSSGETTAVGPYACEFQTTGGGNTCIGEHVIGYDNPTYATGLGVDAMRDAIGVSNTTAIGALADMDGTSGPNTVVGSQSLSGNAGSISIGGSPTVGDVLSIQFTTTNANVIGLPATATYTVVAGDTISSITSGLSTAIHNLNVSYRLSDGNTTQQENGAQLEGWAASPTGTIRFHFPGGNSSGWSITPTTSCSGTCTETLTVNAPFSGIDNIVVGASSLTASALTTGSRDIAIGDFVMQNAIAGSSDNVCIGYSTCIAYTNDHDNVFIGSGAGTNATGGSQYNTVVGRSAGTGIASGAANNTILGGQPLSGSCITSGWNNMELGIDACVPSPTSSNQLSIQNIIYGTGLSGRNGTMSPGRIGIGTQAPNATLTVGSAGGGNDDGHLGFLGAKPTLGGCGTSPSLDATATDGSGTVTEGTTATGCTLTFAVAYATAPHCIISSPSGSAFTSYSTSTTALTIVNASASGNKYSYVCVQ